MPEDKPHEKKLPPFAAEWIQQWKQAAPRLQAIRDEELRRLGDGHHNRDPQDEFFIFDRYPERHGMVIMQRWFMRRYLLEQRASQE